MKNLFLWVVIGVLIAPLAVIATGDNMSLTSSFWIGWGASSLASFLLYLKDKYDKRKI